MHMHTKTHVPCPMSNVQWGMEDMDGAGRGLTYFSLLGPFQKNSIQSAHCASWR
jgi:hypothetical protein